MGTRSLTVMQDKNQNEIAVLYRQMDGYPDGHGQELAEFLSGFAVVSGIGSDTPEKAANGAGCLAAQVVAHFKTDTGGFYLNAAGTRGAGEEYIYFVRPVDGKVRLEVSNGDGGQIFEGSPEEFIKQLPKLSNE